jgi:hypothetical protein
VARKANRSAITGTPGPASASKDRHRSCVSHDNHILIHQIGPDQEGFFRFYGPHILPRL